MCLLTDHETAASAVRNLNGHDVKGRPLRIDLADSDPLLEGKTTNRGELEGGIIGASHPGNAPKQSIPKGVPCATGLKSAGHDQQRYCGDATEPDDGYTGSYEGTSHYLFPFFALLMTSFVFRASSSNRPNKLKLYYRTNLNWRTRSSRLC